jgi:hypothetical protein
MKGGGHDGGSIRGSTKWLCEQEFFEIKGMRWIEIFVTRS